MLRKPVLATLLALVAVGACTIQVPDILPRGTPFIVKGTSET